MRKISLFCLLAFSIFLSSCGGGAEKSSTSEEETQKSNYDQMVETDLNGFGLDASIYLPDESFGKAVIAETSWGSININVGEGFGLEIVPFGMTVEDKKIELSGDLVYRTEFIEETENLLFYTKVIKDSDLEPENHFFYVTKLDGETIEIKNTKERNFSPAQINKMIEAAKSLK